MDEKISPYEFMEFIRFIARHNAIHGVFVVGGFVRDELIFGDSSHAHDIDITCVDANRGRELASLVASELRIDYPQAQHRTGTVTLEIGDIDVDFKGDLILEDYLIEMRKLGVDVNNLTQDIYGRDFTVNTLLRSLQTWKLLDVTGKGLKDLDDGLLRTTLAPHIVLKNNPLIATRAVRFICKLGFDVEDELVDYINKNCQEVIDKIGESRMVWEMSLLTKYDLQDVMEAIDKVGLDKKLISKDAMDVLRGMPIPDIYL
ncbi:MAG: hypothetical protein AABY32_02700 [Nanoarchaeota archaeon]